MFYEEILLPIILSAMGLGIGPLIWYIVYTTKEKSKTNIRKMYLELVKRKLDVIQTGLTMGYREAELRELDQRLERLIGTQEMLKTLQAGKELALSERAELLDTDLVREVERQADSRRQRSQG